MKYINKQLADALHDLGLTRSGEQKDQKNEKLFTVSKRQIRPSL